MERKRQTNTQITDTWLKNRIERQRHDQRDAKKYTERQMHAAEETCAQRGKHVAKERQMTVQRQRQQKMHKEMHIEADM